MRTASEIIDSLRSHGWVEQSRETARVFQSKGGTLTKVVFADGTTAEAFACPEHTHEDNIPVKGCRCLACEGARAAKI